MPYVPAKPLFGREDLRKLIIPLVIEQILAVMVGMADVVMVSSVGEAAVSGVSLVDMISVLLINIFAAMATGGAVVASQLLGAEQPEKAREAGNQLITVTFLIFVAITAGVLVFREPLLRLLFGSIDADVMENSLIYLQITGLSYPFLACYNSGAALFRSMNNAKITMIVSAGMNLINIAGNALCVYGLDMGIAGVAVPSLVSRAAAAAAICFLLSRKRQVIYLHPRQMFRLKWQVIRNILYIGIPSALENGMFQLGRVLVVSIISAFGTVQIAANAVANNLDAVGCIPGQAMNLAIITVVGQCVGALDYDQAAYYIKKLLKIIYLIMGIVCGGVLLTLPWVLRFYNLSVETMELATLLIWIHDGCAILLWPAAFTLPNGMRAANDVKFTLFHSVFAMWIFRILFSWIIGMQLGMGAIGVWIAMVMDWVYRAGMFIWRFHSRKWTQFTRFNKNGEVKKK